MNRIFITIALGLLVVGCKHPLDIIGVGDITSPNSPRGCSYEDSLVDAPPCADNEVNIPDAYVVTYVAEPRDGWYFHRWHHWCKDNPDPVCVWNIGAGAVEKAPNAILKAQVAIFREEEISGYNSLFMGHSLFDTVAVGVENLAVEAALSNHEQLSVFFPATQGAPINIWNDPARKAIIQATLDVGDVFLFGMSIQEQTIYDQATPLVPPYTENAIEGWRQWIDYAFEKNPDVRILVGVPHLQRPEMDFADAAAYEAAWDAHLQNTIQPMVDQLRLEFPYTDIFIVPYGEAAAELYKQFEAGNLPAEDVGFLTSTTDGIFRDAHGHAGSMLLALSQLVWLSAIYGVDMASFVYDPGYTTDLKSIAGSIVASQNPNYAAPHLTP